MTKADLVLHPIRDNYDHSKSPVKGKFTRAWFEEDRTTADHAKHCLPLLIANSIGFYLTSPLTFDVAWDGDLTHSAIISNQRDQASHAEISTHSAFGSFTVQSQVVPRTEESWLTMVKQVPNVRSRFHAMEAIIESYWSPANFGIVCLLNQPGSFTIHQGDPLAQLIVIHESSLYSELTFGDLAITLKDRASFEEKRQNYTKKQLNYFRGEWFEDETKISPIPHHLPNKVADKQKCPMKTQLEL